MFKLERGNLWPINPEKRMIILTYTAVFLLLPAIIMGGASLWYWHNASILADIYTVTYQGLQQQIIDSNTHVKKLQADAGTIRRECATCAHWTPALIYLAESKPSEIQVQEIRVQAGRIYIHTHSQKDGAAKKWQDRMSKCKFFQRVNIVKINHEKGLFSVELEIHLSTDGTHPKEK